MHDYFSNFLFNLLFWTYGRNIFKLLHMNSEDIMCLAYAMVAIYLIFNWDTIWAFVIREVAPATSLSNCREYYTNVR